MDLSEYVVRIVVSGIIGCGLYLCSEWLDLRWYRDRYRFGSPYLWLLACMAVFLGWAVLRLFWP